MKNLKRNWVEQMGRAESVEKEDRNTQYQINEIGIVPVSEEYPKGIKFESLGSGDARGIINYLLSEDESMIGYKLFKKQRKVVAKKV